MSRIHDTAEGTNSGSNANLLEANRITATPHKDAMQARTVAPTFESRVSTA